MSTSNENMFPVTTVMLCLFFGTNALLFVMFYLVKNMNGKPPTQDITKEKAEKQLSKPFIGTLDCFYNLTIELFRTGLIMALTYICENNWIYPHSGKEYSRDLFTFVLIIFFGYAYYTIKPVHDLTLLSREQTEEWKGWMQFIFLLYHYFHAEEVYNSVRVMITCYVWMTGFGNFSFFYIKQDFGWLRVVQMLWRLNFSVILLMWTHGNTYILYYICPMHTFYFLMVYVTMYIYSSVNHSKWAIRFKLLALGVIIYIIWDINGGLFDILFAFLGTESVNGAGSGSVWEYYFRTSLDHWSSYLGMIFALNFPLAEQYFVKAKGYPLILASAIMAAVSVWWYFEFYTKEKMDYNLTHSYSAIIPLTSYIFFRNLTPAIRSGVSMSLHDLGKTTLETYLLQHHIWLTSNAKTLLTIVPDHPWINFALATILFFVTSKELYRLTMSLRGMIMPDDKNITWNNCIGMILIFTFLYLVALAITALGGGMTHIVLACLGLLPASVLIINRFARQTADNFAFQQWSSRFSGICSLLLVIGIFGLFVSRSEVGSSNTTNFIGSTPQCQAAISQGHWDYKDCIETPATTLDKAAKCGSYKWVWENQECPVGKINTAKARSVFKGKKIVFVGDSILRNTYHQFNKLLDPAYRTNSSISMKHSDLTYKNVKLLPNTTVTFKWAPFVKNVTENLKSYSKKHTHQLFIAGSAAWDALYVKDLKSYVADLNDMAASAGSPGKMITVWVQPTTIIDSKLPSQEKQQYMTESNIGAFRDAFLTSKAAPYFTQNGVIVNPTSASKTRESGSVDGVHYSEEVYAVMAQMVANSYAMRNPANYPKKAPLKKYDSKRTGSMSFPVYGAWVLLLSFIMLFTMDNFLGVGFLSLQLFGRSFDWEAGYGPLLKKLHGGSKPKTPELATRPAGKESENEVDKLLGSVESGVEMVGQGKH